MELSINQQKFLKSVESGISQDSSGHYTIPLPLKQLGNWFPDNRQQAVKHAMSLKKQFIKNNKFHDDYVKFMQAMFDEGHAEIINPTELNQNIGKRWYIPHHGVYHPRKNKIRVVFNCAASYGGVSLNDMLLTGPDLTNSIVGVLTRFRQDAVAVKADIKGMFLQVNVPKEDQDFLRFVWWPKGDVTETLVDCRMTVYLFGTTASPSCANFALRKTALDNESSVSRLVRDSVLSNFYVDDLLTSLTSIEQAKLFIPDITELLKKGGFSLTKWISNKPEVLSNLKSEHIAQNLDILQFKDTENATEMALGMNWHVLNDTISFRTSILDRPATKRGVLYFFPQLIQFLIP